MVSRPSVRCRRDGIQAQPFRVVSSYAPAGDQPRAIVGWATPSDAGDSGPTLLGITGPASPPRSPGPSSGPRSRRWSSPRTRALAAQLARVRRRFSRQPGRVLRRLLRLLPARGVHPVERHVHREGLRSIDDEIDRLRTRPPPATHAPAIDVIVVASVSCIYGMGTPRSTRGRLILLSVGLHYDHALRPAPPRRPAVHRNDHVLGRGRFRVRGNTIKVHPSYEESVLRIEMFGDTVDRLTASTRSPARRPASCRDSPSSPPPTTSPAPSASRGPSPHRGRAAGPARLVRAGGQAARGAAPADADAVRPRDDGEVGSATGSRTTPCPSTAATWVGRLHTARLLPRRLPRRPRREPPGRAAAARPVRGRPSRKAMLVDHGFQLPSARDNAPLRFEEFLQRVDQCAFVSATPGPCELRLSSTVVEQIVRPTGLVDPEVVVKLDQGPDRRPHRGHRRPRRAGRPALVTTLTKKMAEDLTEYLLEQGLRVPLPALQRRHRAAHRDPPGPAARRVRRAGRHQPPARASTCRRCRWWPSSTPTRRGSCGPRRPSCRRSAGPPATSTARSSCTPTR